MLGGIGKRLIAPAVLATVAVAAGCETQSGALIEISSEIPIAVGSDLKIAVGTSQGATVDNGNGSGIYWIDDDVQIEHLEHDLQERPYRYFIGMDAVDPDGPDDSSRLFPVGAAAFIKGTDEILAVGSVFNDVALTAGEIRKYELVLGTPPDDWNGCAGGGDSQIDILGNGCSCELGDPNCPPCDPNDPNCEAPVCTVDAAIIAGTQVYEACDGRDNDCNPATEHQNRSVCYTVINADSCRVGMRACGERGGQDTCIAVGQSPTASPGVVGVGGVARDLCQEYTDCVLAGDPDPTACVHRADLQPTTLETIVCQPRYDDTGEACGDYVDLGYELSAAGILSCAVRSLAATAGPEWSGWGGWTTEVAAPGSNGVFVSDVPLCDVRIDLSAPMDRGLTGEHTEFLFTLEADDSALGPIAAYFRLVIVPEKINGLCDDAPEPDGLRCASKLGP